MRWVLIRPGNVTPYYDPEVQEPLGLGYLAAVLRRAGQDVLVLDAVLDGHTDIRLARRAVSFAPDCIGVSMTTAQEVDSILAIYREVRQLPNGRNMAWIAGGNFITSECPLAEAILPEEFALVRFEGEQAVCGMIAELEAVRQIPSRDGGTNGGRFWRQRVVAGTAVEDLAALPFAARPYARQILAANKVLNLQGSRGCCGNCRYCSSPGMVPPGEKRWRGRPIQHVVEEIEFLHRHFGAASFNFIDEDFLGPNSLATERAGLFSQLLRQLPFQVTFGIQVRPDSLTPAVIETLAQIGLNYVFMGIESDDPADLRRWGRPWRTDPWPLVEQLHRLGIDVNAGVMMWHPQATLVGIRRFAQRLHHYGLLEYRSAINRLDAMPGSQMYREARDQGEIVQDKVGPQSLPFQQAEVGELHRDLLAALAPLGPPSMHALCSLPPTVAAGRVSPQIECTLRRLRSIIRQQDDAVAETFFALLETREKNESSAELVGGFRARNFAISMESAAALTRIGLAPSVDALREAIRIDAGM